MDKRNQNCWQAVLTPHRSLSRGGYLWLMGLVALVNLAVGTLFYTIGAWPVAGFAGLDVLAVWWAFHVNFADARRSERIVVTEHEVILERSFRGSLGQRQSFMRRWVRVDLDEDRERELVGGLYLVSRGMRTEVGQFLAPSERRDLAAALRSALAIPRI